MLSLDNTELKQLKKRIHSDSRQQAWFCQSLLGFAEVILQFLKANIIDKKTMLYQFYI